MMQWKKSADRLLLVIGIGIYLLMSNSVGYGEEVSLYKLIEEVALPASQIPQGWVLEKEIRTDEAALNKFEQIYGVRATALINQIFMVNNKRLQVNYCLFESEPTAGIAVLKMKSLVGNTDLIFDRKNAVLELISEDPWLKQEALKLLRPDPLNEYLVTQKKLPQDWMLWNIILVDKSKMPFFENRLGARIDTIINQIFRVGEDVVKINYVLCTDKSQREKVYEQMQKVATKDNSIIKKKKVVIEIVAYKEQLRQKAKDIVD